MRQSQVDKRARRELTKQSVSDYEIDTGETVSKTERIQAPVKFFSKEKGYGFIKRLNKPDIFFTDKELGRSGLHVVKEDELLEFDLIPVAGKGGKAANIKKVTK